MKLFIILGLTFCTIFAAALAVRDVIPSAHKIDANVTVIYKTPAALIEFLDWQNV